MSHQVTTVDTTVINIAVTDQVVAVTSNVDNQIDVAITDTPISVVTSGATEVRAIISDPVPPIIVNVSDPSQPSLIEVDPEIPLADLTTRLDDVGGGILYLGKAIPGTLTSLAAWKVQKITELSDGDIDVLWADGNANFDNIWDNHLSFIYS